MEKTYGNLALKLKSTPAPGLNEVVNKILLDAKKQPKDYLKETIVPEGGE